MCTLHKIWFERKKNYENLWIIDLLTILDQMRLKKLEKGSRLEKSVDPNNIPIEVLKSLRDQIAILLNEVN